MLMTEVVPQFLYSGTFMLLTEVVPQCLYSGTFSNWPERFHYSGCSRYTWSHIVWGFGVSEFYWSQQWCDILPADRSHWGYCLSSNTSHAYSYLLSYCTSTKKEKIGFSAYEISGVLLPNVWTEYLIWECLLGETKLTCSLWSFFISITNLGSVRIKLSSSLVSSTSSIHSTTRECIGYSH